MADRKPVEFRGSSLADLRAFPEQARRESGHQIDQVQQGVEPDDWKPMPSIGPGVKEIRVRDASGAFRVVCGEVCKSNLRTSLFPEEDPEN